jgi:hypothetical protein
VLRVVLAFALTSVALVAASSSAGAAPTWVNAATYNIRYNSSKSCEPSSNPAEAIWPYRKPLVVRHILDPNLDGSRGDMVEVLGVQEAKDGDTCQTPESMWEDLRDDLIAMSGQPWVVADAANPSSGHNRILYNSATYGLVDAGAVRFSAQVPGEFSRYLAWAILTHKATGKQFLFTTTHLSPGNDCAVKAQWTEAIGLAGQLSGGRPIIATGDYNATRYNTSKADCKVAKMFKFTKRAGIGDVMGQKLGTNKVSHRRAVVTHQQYLGSSNGWNPSTSAWGYPRKPKRIGKGMIDFIFASNHLPVYQWGTSADITPDRLSLQNGFPSDHNMIFAQIGLP